MLLDHGMLYNALWVILCMCMVAVDIAEDMHLQPHREYLSVIREFYAWAIIIPSYVHPCTDRAGEIMGKLN